MVLGLDLSKKYQMEHEEREALLRDGVLVCSTVTTEHHSSFDAPSRHERRVVRYPNGHFYLMHLTSWPQNEPSGRWLIYGKEYFGRDFTRGPLRRIANSADNAREDEEAKIEMVFKGNYRKPQVDWVTESRWQMTHLERSQIARWEKTSK